MVENKLPQILILSAISEKHQNRWGIFQKIFRSAFEKQDLLENATTRKDLSYYLVYEVKEKEKHPIGIVIFQSTLYNGLKKIFKLKDALYVKALHLTSLNENFPSALFKIASQSKALSIAVRVLITNRELNDFMEKMTFKKMSAQLDDCHLYKYLFKNETQKPSAAKRAKTEEDLPLEPEKK